MQELKVAVGDETVFSKTVGESDVYLFAGITGDFAPNHVNEDFMGRTRFARRQAHGALMVGFMSTGAGLMAQRTSDPEGEIALSAGYDRIRFTAPVYIGDTVSVTYRITAVDHTRRRATADVRIVNQDGTLVAVATHVLAWVPAAG
ncbi:MaoC/PaaZ C-terminal domain-containing protein [Xanthobacter sp. KR7-65]|uniref:MaoC/PaaZ C-terminal domain-containing protein n=1 Tax=Xanthobacter sp. KR7-65 TaxID=3156612 RepID=UPI0032B5EA11